MYEAKNCKKTAQYRPERVCPADCGPGVSWKSMGILTGILLISCIFIFWKFLFGDQLLAYTDIGSDTYDQYLMGYQSIINRLRDSSFSLWDGNNSYGNNMFSMNLFDPFLILMYLVGALFGPDKIYGILVYMQILRIVLAGLSVYGFLSCFALSERSKLYAAYAYALCGYLVVWGQHYQFGTIVVLFPLLLMAAERAMRKKIWLLWLTLFCTLASIGSLYFSYMQFVVLGFYILFRIAWEEKLFCGAGLKKTGKIYGSMILGIGMGMFSLLPSAAMIFGVSGRVGGEPLSVRILSALRPYDRAYYVTLLKRFLSSNLQGINTYSGYMNFYEDSNVYLSALFLLLAAQFLIFVFAGKYRAKQRALLLTALALCGIVLLIPVGSLIFNGFSYPFSRHTFLCLPFFAWIMAAVLHEILENRKIYLPVLVLTALAVAAEYVRIYIGDGKRLALLLGALAVCMAVFLCGAVYFKKKEFRTASMGALALVLMASMSGDAYYAYNCQRGILQKAPTEYFDELYNPSVQEALAYIRENDDSFYRVEKDYTVGTAISCLNSQAQNYSGVSTYNSVLNTGIAEFFEKFWQNLQINNETHHSFANTVNDNFQASLSHVKYVLSKKQDFHVQGYEFYRQFGDIYVYRNTNTEELGKFYSSAFSQEAYESAADWVDQEALLAENVLCDTVPELTRSSDEISAYQRTLAASEEEIVQSTSDGNDILLTLPETALGKQEKYILEFDLTFSEPILELMVTAGEHTTSLTAGPESTHVAVSVPGDVREVRIYQQNVPVTEKAVIANKQLYCCPVRDLSGLSEGIRFEAARKDSEINGTAKVGEKGILMLTVPYENGWHAYVDGSEVTIHKVNYGFSGICLEPGEHRIQLVYRCPGFIPGVVCSVIFALLTVGIWRKERVEL